LPSNRLSEAALPKSIVAIIQIVSVLSIQSSHNLMNVMSQLIALITNAQHFVGRPAVNALLAENFHVIAQDPEFNNAEIRRQFQTHYANAQRETGHTGKLSLMSESNPIQLVEQVWQKYGGLDALISNDAFPAIHTPIENAEISDLQHTLDSLVFHPFQLMQTAIPHIKRQAQPENGQPKRQCNVIFITSCRTELPLNGGAIPDIARAGANALVTSLSLELAPFNIPVNAIAPNYLYSEAYFPKSQFIDNPQGAQYIQSVVPAGRLGDPQEIEELVLYLASMKGSFHTGTVIKFAGGWPAAAQRPASQS